MLKGLLVLCFYILRRVGNGFKPFSTFVNLKSYPSMSIIQIKDLKKIVQKSNTPILNGINLDIEEGETVSITGESGCGKTTLLNIIGGLTRVTEGKVIVKDVEISSMNDSELSEFRNKTIGFIFQNYELLEEHTCFENVVLPILFGDTDIDIKERGMEVLKMVGLEDKAELLPDELSGGQCQRVAIARAIVNYPEIILADEPTSNLDDKTAGGIVEILKGINEKLNTTIVIASHSDEVFHISDKVFTLSDGSLVLRPLKN